VKVPHCYLNSSSIHVATINWSASCGLLWFLYSALPSGLRSGPNRFVLNTTKMNWTEAQSYCREHHTDLALVRNMEENQMVQSLVPSKGRVRIGLFTDPWKWSDGSDSSFRNWNPLEPREPGGSSEICVAADFSADGRWETLDCNVKSAFICVLAPALFK
uniref:C-type lectin domain-containing protein n=1 Tax=Cyclopterus lumpus TaxID=8103 RepID=A0A8C2WKP1_CYCLU